MNLNTISLRALVVGKADNQENGAMSSLDITELFQHLVWTELLLCLSFLPRNIITITIIMYSRPVLGRYLIFFKNHCLFQVLEKIWESKNCQFGVFWKHSETIH
jgi:hypothetical protein